MWEERAEEASPGLPLPEDGLQVHPWEGHVGQGHPCGPRANLHGLGVDWEAVCVPLPSCLTQKHPPSLLMLFGVLNWTEGSSPTFVPELVCQVGHWKGREPRV